jgi:Zn-dependent peptidase ImmA (M78 family)
VSYARVRNRVERLLKGLDEPPVDVEALARSLGAEVRLFRLERDVSGVLYRDKGRRVIVVNSAHPLVRRRFTIAHEIGHLLMHPGQTVHVDQGLRINLRDPMSATAEDIDEVEANAFAANLLMPAGWLRSDLADRSLNLEDATEIQHLAERYKVSQQAMIVRLASLNPR